MLRARTDIQTDPNALLSGSEGNETSALSMTVDNILGDRFSSSLSLIRFRTLLP